MTNLSEAELQKRLSQAPFLQVDGVGNFREYGAKKTLDGHRIKGNLLYRSAELSGLTAEGKQQLAEQLQIKRVFDLRSPSEVQDYASQTSAIEGVELLSVPVSTRPMDPASLASKMDLLAKDEVQGWLAILASMLKEGQNCFRSIFQSLLDHAGEPTLVHCTAGKDRTGVICTLLLSVLHVSNEDIVEDYALSTIGFAPLIPLLAKRLESKPDYQDNKAGFMRMASSKPEVWRAFLDLLQTKYGGGENYVKEQLGFSDADLDRLRSVYTEKELQSTL